MGLRQRIQQQFELAALPGTKEADMRRALHFVVVGGGPTGAASGVAVWGGACWLGRHALAAFTLPHTRRPSPNPPYPPAPPPPGVEFAGTLSDFLREDLKKKYPELMPYVRVSLLNATPSILVQFDEK